MIRVRVRKSKLLSVLDVEVALLACAVGLARDREITLRKPPTRHALLAALAAARIARELLANGKVA